jgi:uncharacterized protein (DUF2141 family)
MAAACVAASMMVITAAQARECEGDRAPGAVRLTVRATAVQSAQGEVVFTVYPDVKRRFLAPGGKLARVRVAAAAPSASACFWLTPGTYALAVYHDANGDRDFNRGPTGAPTEGFAFSNNAPTRVGLPAFEATRFEVGASGRNLTVQMRYLRPGETNR